MHPNRLKRALIVQRLFAEHYQPGRHDRCKLWVYNYIIKDKMPISVSTFFRYLKMDTSSLKQKPKTPLFAAPSFFD